MQDMDNMQVLPPSDNEQVTRRKMQDKLPKFTLGRNEGFYIPREKIEQLNDSYYQMLADMDAGNGLIPEELRSYMESVIFVSYVNEIDKMQRNNYLDNEVERERQETLNCVLTPHRRRSIFTLFRLKRNQSAILLDELISRQAHSYYCKKESELPVSEEDSEAELDPYVVQLDTLRAYLPRMRKKRRIILEGIISGLEETYKGKEAKLQHFSAELQAEKEKVEELTAELKKEAVKRLITCLNAVKEAKKPIDWEILKLRQELEDSQTPKEPEEPIEEDDEIDELENWDDLDELNEESDGEDEEGGDETEPE